MPTIPADRLQLPVVIEQPKAGTPDTFGTLDQSDNANWETYCSRRAEIKPTSGGELQQGRQRVANVGYKLTLRADQTTRLITPKMRVKWVDTGISTTRYLNIEKVLDVGGGHQTIELSCKESA